MPRPSLAAFALVAALVGTSTGCSSCAHGGAPAVDASSAAPVTSPELRLRLREAARAKGPGYVPRTRHREPDGSPTYTNRLILESSPYLLQHAHNPVDWFPWGDEAFEAARRLGRPVLLSVGYSTCHWCHVMEEESFENDEIATYLNANYVAIKVDREERPDIDAIYLAAVQAMTGGGGWPMTVWLTPERKPFFGGTYFPAHDGERGTKLGFLSTLKKFRATYDGDPKAVAEAAAELTQTVRRELTPAGAGGATSSTAALDGAAAQYRSRFDAANGGLRGAPKFPSSLSVRFLLRDQRRRSNPESLAMATTTLEHLARGGIHDQIGGGFHRYSTDEKWLIPHFEKMLYDNALLARTYVEAYQVTHRQDFADVARDIFAYVERDLLSSDGAFFSASDADSLTAAGRREEGWFFTWTPAEVTAVLGPADAGAVATYFGITANGNFDGRNVLSLATPPVPAPPQLGTAREALRQARLKRPAPARDDKVLTSWNGLMISAYARAGLVLAEPRHADRAEHAADFVLRSLAKDGRLLRSFKDGQAKSAAYLDDYAFFIAALLDLHEATGRLRWLEEAVRLDRVVEQHYEDASDGGFFLTADDQEQLLARDKPSYDGAEPSGGSVEVLNLLRLHALTTKDAYRTRAERAVQSVGRALASAPTGLSELLLALDFQVDTPKEIVIVTPSGRDGAEPFLARLREIFLPNAVLVVVAEGGDLDALQKLVPLVEAKVAKGGKATAYVCKQGSCELPTADPDVFARLVRKN